MDSKQVFPGEIGLGLGIVLLTGASFFIIQSVFNMATTVQNRYVELLPYTTASEDKQVVIQQDIKKFPDGKPILPSDNERTGIEFSYNFYLFVNETTFNGDNEMRSVFYKGYGNNPWPLQSPGVYILGNTNTMRVIMSSYDDPYQHIDIENIPINKWFHVALNFQKLALEVHINGKIVKKLSYNNTLPYLNYQNLTIFPNTVNKTTVRRPILPDGTTPEDYVFSSAIYGKVSNLIYTRYALSFNEIQNFYSKGPSTITKVAKNMETPPYLSDSWWTNQ